MKQPKKVSSDRQIVVRPGEPFIRGRELESRNELINNRYAQGTKARTASDAAVTAGKTFGKRGEESVISAFRESLAAEGKRKREAREAKAKK